MKYNSLSDKNKTEKNVISDPQKVPIGPSHLLNKKIFKQCIINNIGGKENKFSKNNIKYKIEFKSLR